MSQMLSQLPRQLLQQQQRLTPQLIQAMDILQLNALALESRIAQEIDSNPALELAPGDESPSGETPGAVDEARTEVEPGAEEASDDFGRLETLLNEYELFGEEYEYRGAKSRARLSEEGDSKLEAMANTEARGVGLQEHLLEQWRFAEVDPQAARIGEAIINALNEFGRLEMPLEKLAEDISPRPNASQMEDALARVQLLDPPGVAARDLQECLLLQLEAATEDTELAREIVSRHFDDLQRNRLPLIAKSLHVSVDEVKAAMRQIARLSLHPGLDVTDRGAPAVTPDIIVEYDEENDRYETRLARGNQRELRISPEFREALEKARDDKPAREFLRQKLEAASAIIDAVNFRRDRLLQVAKAAIAGQRAFLDKGDQHLKVLLMSDVAVQLGCDPSTISRTVDQKWVQTPRGIIALRRFFTGGADFGGGEQIGWESIRAKVQEIIANEDKSNPLSDDQIVEKLRAEGIDIKRRTVAKYRSQLGIPTGRQRRQY